MTSGTQFQRPRKPTRGEGEDLDKKIGKKELQKVLEGLPLGKQAGPDRIPNAVFKMLPTFFAEKIEKLVAEITRTGEMPDYMLRQTVCVRYNSRVGGLGGLPGARGWGIIVFGGQTRFQGR